MTPVADLITLDELKVYAGVKPSNTDDDGLLADLVSGASTAVQEFIGRRILSASYTETRNGTGRCVLPMAHAPITAVGSITVDSVAIPARTTVPGTGYSFDASLVYLDGYTFTRGMQNITVIYTAGFTLVPRDLARATCEVATFMYRRKDRIGESSKMFAQQTINYSRDLDPWTVRVLNQWVRPIAAMTGVGV